MAMEREEATSLATGALKKVIAGRGKIQGNFYFVADSAGKEAVLVATLASKDKKGAVAVNQGRPFRKELKGARYARGSITFEKGKVVFVVHQGTANKKGMLDGLRTVLSKEKGLGFLKKAVVTMASASEEEQQQDRQEGGEVDSETLEQADQSTSSEEIAVLTEAQGDLSGLSDFFQKSDKELEAAFAQEVGETLSRLQQLQQQDPIDELAQEAARTALAALVAVGHDSLPQLGVDLPPELFQVLLTADSLILGEDEGDEDEDEVDLGAQLLKALQRAEQRYFASGEPDEVAEWILKAEALHQQDKHEEGLAILADEVEWRLVRAERNESVQEEIVGATGGGQVALGRLLIGWREAESTARQQLAYFQNLVLTDPEVTTDPRFQEIEPRVKAFTALLPSAEGVHAALNAYIEATPEDRPEKRSSLSSAVQTYTQKLESSPQLQALDSTAFGTVAIYSTLVGALQTLRDHLSGSDDVG